MEQSASIMGEQTDLTTILPIGMVMKATHFLYRRHLQRITNLNPKMKPMTLQKFQLFIWTFTMKSYHMMTGGIHIWNISKTVHFLVTLSKQRSLVD
ncbi:hypothetical protein FRX31_031751 [Thalictrum thalictroides]|uniref:Uncharacterized protein n=1 Tax=Thalictrum thalictroides TaxID=46969 RepID=A0A7J6V1J6_THATH|nr:hypothetical protein FRX31_031751 [Thalictrum thalictroides]